MIEKRYSDGKLAKWYYSQENVISDGTNEYYLASKESIRNVDYSMLLGTNDLLDELNRLSDEYEQLKQQVDDLLRENEELKSDLDYFYRTYEIEERGLDIVAPMCTIGSPTPCRLELFKENKQLKQEIETLHEQLAHIDGGIFE